jgi:hypothetical protein
MNNYLILTCIVVGIIAAFTKQGLFNKLFALFTASVFAILTTYKDTNRIFIAVLISFTLNFVLLLTSKEYKEK